MPQQFTDNARALLTSGIGAGDLSLTVEAAKADRFPSANTTNWATPLNFFKVVLIDSAGNREVIKVGTRSLGSAVMGNILRGQDGTVARAFTTSTTVIGAIFSADLQTALTGALPALTIPVGNTMSQGGVFGRFTPIGAIIMWSGSVASIPVGYALCDGTLGTPDLRNKFVMGAGLVAPATAGGTRDAVAVSHTHSYSATTSGQSAGHTHTGSTAAEGGHTHAMFGGNVGRILLPGVGGGGNYGAGPASTGDYINTGAGSAHAHTLITDAGSADHSHTLSGTTVSAGVAGTDQNLPPYYALALIMCVA